MRRCASFLMIMALVALALPLAALADDAPGPTVRHLYRVDGLPLAGLAEVVRFVNEFPAGAATPPHTHPGLTIGTVLEGEVTLREAGKEKAYRVGESFTEMPGVVVTALNNSAGRTRVIATIVLPKGAAPSTPQPGAPSPAPPTPTSVYPSRFDAVFSGEPYEVAQAVLDFAPGAQTPTHTHPGQVFVTVLEGEITFTTGGATRVYKPGESFVEPPDVVGQARNAGTVPATVMATYLLPKGAPLSAPVVTPGMPATGGGGMAVKGSAAIVPLLSWGAGLLTLAGGLCRRHRCIRRVHRANRRAGDAAVSSVGGEAPAYRLPGWG